MLPPDVPGFGRPDFADAICGVEPTANRLLYAAVAIVLAIVTAVAWFALDRPRDTPERPVATKAAWMAERRVSPTDIAILEVSAGRRP